MEVVIYKIVNKINNKAYIGVSKRVKERFRQHLSDAKNKKYDTYFYSAIRKYGKESFELNILETLDSEVDAYSKESTYIRDHKTLAPDGYNSHEGGRGGCMNPSNDLRKKLSDAKIGISVWNKGKIYEIKNKFNRLSRKKLIKGGSNKKGKAYTEYHLTNKHTLETVVLIGNYTVRDFCKSKNINWPYLFKNKEKNWIMNVVKL